MADIKKTKRGKRIFLGALAIGAISLSLYQRIDSFGIGNHRFDFIQKIFSKEDVRKGRDIIIATVIVLSTGTSFSKPGDWNNGANTIECYGAGGGGGLGQAFACCSGNFGGGGGGGGGYSLTSNVTISGATAAYAIGAGGTPAVSGGTTSFAGATSATGGTHGAQSTGSPAPGGVGGSGTRTGGTGGSTAEGLAAVAGGGGGGCAGPSSGGGSGSGASPGAGGGGQAGSGGTGVSAGNGGNGNQYGGGGAGAGVTAVGTPQTAGTGFQGVIVVTYTPLVTGGYFSTFYPPAAPPSRVINNENRNAQQRDFQMFLPAPGLPNQNFGYDFYQWPNAPRPINFAKDWIAFYDRTTVSQFFGYDFYSWPNAPRPINFAKDWIAFSGNLGAETLPAWFPPSNFDPAPRPRNFAKDWIEYSEIGFSLVPVSQIELAFLPFSPGLTAKLWSQFGQQPQWWTYNFTFPVPKPRDTHDSGDYIPRYHSRRPPVYDEEYYKTLEWMRQPVPPELAQEPEEEPRQPNLVIPLDRILKPVHLASLHQSPPHRPVPSLTTNPPQFRMASPQEIETDDEMIIRLLLEE